MVQGGALGNRQGEATCFTALWLCVGGGLGERTMLLPGFLALTFFLVTPLIGGNWCPSSYCPGAESQRGWVFGRSKAMWTLQVEYPENPAVSSAAPTPPGFYSRKLWGFIFLALEPWTAQSGLGLGSLTLKVSLPIFICKCGTIHSATATALRASPSTFMTPPLLHIWLNASSLNPWLSDFHTARFSDSSGCYLF